MMNPVFSLYSYRRCPYAMRARMALVAAGIQCEVHEIDFKNKPAHMLDISPKGTVPVLWDEQGLVIEESLEIAMWALGQNDPQGWLACDVEEMNILIAENDCAFKAALDRYKYPGRFDGEDCSNARENALIFLQKLDARLQAVKHLMGADITLADIAIFPFIRQFANVDRAWFDGLDLKPLQMWLNAHLNSELFLGVMKKYKDNPHQLIS